MSLPALVHEHILSETLPLPLTALILCGGKSERMGRSKALLPFAGKTMIEHVLNKAKEIFAEVLISTNEVEPYAELGVDVVKDILPFRGPAGGILSGLLVARHQHCFVLACDMPLLSRRLIRDMCANRFEAELLLLEHDSGIELFPGIYSKSCVEVFESTLFDLNDGAGELVKHLTPKTFKLSSPYSNHDGLPPYFSVDTPSDYSKVLTTANHTHL